MTSSPPDAPPTAEFLASVVECSDDAIITKDLNGHVTSWNESAERIFGYTAAEMIGNPISILAAPDRIDEMPDILGRVTQGDRIEHYQTLRKTKDGRILHISLTVSPVKDATGRIVGASKIARDITEQVRAGERLAELNAALVKSEAQARQTRDWLETMLKGIGDAVIATDANGRITLLNAVAESLTGWRQDDAIGRPLDEVFVISNEETGATVENPAGRALREGRIVGLANHTCLTAKDGRRIPIDDSAAPFRSPDGTIQGVVLVFRDITTRKDAEQRLTALRDQLVSVTDSMAAAVTRCSCDFRYVWVSGAYASWLRRPKNQIEGRYIRDVIGEKGFEEIRPYMERALTGEKVEYTTRVNFLGPGIRWIQAVYVPTCLQGQVDGWIAVVTDITDTVRYEEQLRAANGELARANTDLNQFAFAASHDLQEPLRMITSYSQLLLKGYRGQLNGQAETYVQWITEGTRRMRDLLADLLAYTQVTAGGQAAGEPVDLNLVFQETLENCKATIQETGASVTRDPLPVVPGHNPHFMQLFQNLIGNALKYRSERPPRIHVSAVKEGGNWRLGVADNGIGIDPQYHPKIFGVFKRLHGSTIPGTGVGLAICQRVVERGGGRIWVESHEGQGATFYFTLPAVKASVAHGT